MGPWRDASDIGFFMVTARLSITANDLDENALKRGDLIAMSQQRYELFMQGRAPACRLSRRVGSGSCCRIGGHRIQPETRSRGDHRGLTAQ